MFKRPFTNSSFVCWDAVQTRTFSTFVRNMIKLWGWQSFDKTFVCNRLAVWMEALTSWRLICHKTPHHIIHKERPQRKDNFMQTTIWKLRGGFLKQECKFFLDSDYCGNFMHKTPTLSLSLDKRDSGTGQTYPDNLTCLIVHWSHETTMCMLQLREDMTTK